MSRNDPLNPAERVTLACSCLVVAVLVGLIALQMRSSQDPAAPVAAVEAVTERDGFHHVEVTIENTGDHTAANVQVSAELTVEDEVTEGDQVIDFLAGGAVEQLVFVFEDDPDEGDLRVSVTGFGVP